ncbi:flagellar motor protein MotB [Paenibacillus sp. GCM10012307]|uniref:Flagellar motor protein MotB n=1 Tax=Paenibacillus roseus TaxID=2798579 RepID=A0A934J5M9_9BACL|nr:flagellar motor protein MotB [Paenibacillus roseus]MBJ6360778.1 flagellar motor protein MotB [Paenibacillus roseus]
MSKKRKHDEHDEHMDESWLIPYADLMTLLLALFIVLYAASSVDAKKFEEMSQAFSIAFNRGNGLLESSSMVTTGQQMTNQNKLKNMKDGDQQEMTREQLVKKEQEDLEKLKKQLDQYIDKNGLSSDLETKLNQTQLLITISDNALFSSGSAAVKQESRKLAVAIANMLQQYPDYNIIVAGHTDNQPISNTEFESNWELSSKRAIRFMNILLVNPNIDRQRFSAIAYGEYQPVDTNATTEGRAKNRRVEVSIMRNYVSLDNTDNISVQNP